MQNTTASIRCISCSADVILDLSYGGELYYQCQNPRCKRPVSVDYSKAKALRENEILAGSLDGQPVIALVWGEQDHEEAEHKYEILSLEVTWMEQKVTTDTKTVNLPHTGCFEGDMSLAEYAWLKEAISANVIERLIAMGRTLVGKPLPHFNGIAPQPPRPTAPAAAIPARPALPGKALTDVIIEDCVSSLEDNRAVSLTRKQLYGVIGIVGRIVEGYLPVEYRYDPTLKVAFVSELDEYKRGYWQAWKDMRDVLEGRMDKEELLKKAA